jgi:hypothetical protein
MCLDSVEYTGLIKLYTDYNALTAINTDFKKRFNLLDGDYILCTKSLKTAVNSLIILNESRDSLVHTNLILYDKSINYERKIKNWRIFGTSVSVSLIGVVTCILLTN